MGLGTCWPFTQPHLHTPTRVGGGSFKGGSFSQTLETDGQTLETDGQTLETDSQTLETDSQTLETDSQTLETDVRL